MTRSTGLPVRPTPMRDLAGRMLAKRSSFTRSSPDGLIPPFSRSGYCRWSTGPRMIPGALRAASITSSGSVDPRALIVFSPMSIICHSSPSLNFALARSSTASVASVISGPMPSPGSTRISMSFLRRNRSVAGRRGVVLMRRKGGAGQVDPPPRISLNCLFQLAVHYEEDYMRRIIVGLVAACAALAFNAAAQEKINLSIATGGTGGVYYPLGGGMANVFSKHIPGMQATAEVTGGSVDNMRLIGTGKSYIALTQADAAKDALNGDGKFKDGKIPVRAMMMLYTNLMHVVTIEGTG